MLIMIFFLMIRRPPRPTLTDTRFPHPALFRSATSLRPHARTRRTVVGRSACRPRNDPPVRVRAGDHHPRLCAAAHAHWRRRQDLHADGKSEEHTSELQSLMRISYAVFCLKTKKKKKYTQYTTNN